VTLFLNDAQWYLFPFTLTSPQTRSSLLFPPLGRALLPLIHASVRPPMAKRQPPCAMLLLVRMLYVSISGEISPSHHSGSPPTLNKRCPWVARAPPYVTGPALPCVFLFDILNVLNALHALMSRWRLLRPCFLDSFFCEAFVVEEAPRVLCAKFFPVRIYFSTPDSPAPEFSTTPRFGLLPEPVPCFPTAPRNPPESRPFVTYSLSSSERPRTSLRPHKKPRPLHNPGYLFSFPAAHASLC